MPLVRRHLLAGAGVLVGVSLVAIAIVLSRRPTSPEARPLPPPTTLPPLASAAGKYPNLGKVLADPKIGSVLQELAIAYDKDGIEGARAFAKERGLLNGNDDVTLTVLTETDDTAALEAGVKDLGGEVVGRGDRSIDVIVPWRVVEERAKSGKPPEELLDRLATLPDVRGVVPMRRPSIQQKGPVGGSRNGTTEGVRATRADVWHKAGFRGQGVKVGVLDPEVSKAPRFVGTAIPAGTLVRNGSCVSPSGTPVDDEGIHGVAAAEIVHEMAPDAQIYLACSMGDEDAAIDWLVSQGVKIISYSAGGMYGPRNGKGRSESRVDALTSRGVLWVNAAGNEGDVFHRGSLEGGASGNWHSFGPGRTALRFTTQSQPKVHVTILWSEWSNTLISDYDLYLFDAKLHEIARSENKNTFLHDPSEDIVATLRPDTTYYVGVRSGGSTRPAPFVLDVHGAASIEQNDPRGSITTPADAAGAFAVGGVAVGTDRVATYSSRGPTEDGRLKPDISAPTEVSSLAYGHTFAGTSAAAPHVAGAAALVWGRFPAYSRNDVVALLASRARDLGAPGPDTDYGAGRLDLGDPATVPAQPPAIAKGPANVVPIAPPSPTPPGDAGTESLGLGRTLFVVGLAAAGTLVAMLGSASLVRSRSHDRARAPWPPPGYQDQRSAVRAPAPAWAASLVTLSGFAGRGVDLAAEYTTFGRTPENAVVIPSSDVSSRHAYVHVGSEGCTLFDLSSRNGTWVNGARVTSHLLRPGDVVRMGPATFRFEVRAAYSGNRA